MKNKFEKLSDVLFEHKLDNNEASKIIGGQGITHERFETHVTVARDTIDCGEDFRGRSCGKLVVWE
ncbi:hypothetical protein [Tenacibaculum ovolyticum]|uniref:hypothetical protein n=1 Tax=Tenacibaculum ovolyticum TaxID=104270 RepID=UPI001F2C479B|nr:hypothetical protein [Tenacibaculum ovolyticum]